MDNEEITISLLRYAELVKDNFNPSRIIVFGSWVRGNWNEDSDIDVAVLVPEIQGDFLHNESLLYRLRRHIDDRIEPILLEETNDVSGFIAEISSYGKVIYARE